MATHRFQTLDRSPPESADPVDTPVAPLALPPRILVVQPQGMERRLAEELQSRMPGAVIRSCDAELASAMDSAFASGVDLVVVGTAKGCEAFKPGLLRKPAPGRTTRPVMICYNECSGTCARDLMRSGISALLPDTVSPSALVRVVELVLSGLRYAPPDLMIDGHEPAEADQPIMADLSPRERQVAAYLAQGQSNKEIARRLGLSEITIKVHVSNLLRKLRARNRTEAASQILASGFRPADQAQSLP